MPYLGPRVVWVRLSIVPVPGYNPGNEHADMADKDLAGLTSMTRLMHKPSHELIVQTPKGNSHYKAAGTDKLQDGIAEVTITFGALQATIAGDWLDMGTYPATYQVGENRARGSFAVYAFRSSVEQIRFVGTFTREGVTWKGDAATRYSVTRRNC